MKLILGYDAEVAAWAAGRIEHLGPAGFGPCTAIGVAPDDSPYHLAAAVVYHDYQPTWRTMQISATAVDPRWAQRGVIRACLSYPFDQLKIRKLWSCIGSGNERALRFNKGLGFTQEAILAKHFGTEHAIITRMFDKDYRRRWGAVAKEAQDAAA